MISKLRGFKTICMLLAVALLLPAFAGTAYAEEEQGEKTVRVGYMMYDGYQHGEEGEPKSGSAYEYYQKIRYYTGWEYEYVYGSISEIFEKLENGEIDIMAVVTYTEERAEKYYFSNESHGSEAYFLYTHAENEEITPANLKTLNGKNVGVTLGSYQELYFRNWCEEEGIECNIISYNYIDDMRAALTSGEVDAMVDVSVLGARTESRPWKSIYRFTSVPLYFAVSKTRPDLLQELNDAQAYIVATDEYYGYEVMHKYHDGVNYYNTYLTKGQQRYLQNVGTIQVGYLEGTNPLSFTDSDTGEMGGICAEYLAAMSEAYGMEFETHVYTSETALIEDLIAKKLDVILPIGMGYWAAEEAGIALSASIYSLPMTAIYKKADTEANFDKIALIKNSPTQEGYVMTYYPTAERYYVNNTREALEAVENGVVDCYFVRSSSMDYLNHAFQVYDQFRTMSVLNNMEAFLATRIGDTTLSIILDKGISLLTDAERESAKLRYDYETGKASLWEAVKDNMGIVAGISVTVLFLCVLFVLLIRLQMNNAYMKTLEAARDKAEKAEQAKTEFLSQMSHDIRTPMNAIIGFTNFIKEEDDLETIKESYVPKIETASNHLIMLINDVLEMSRIETGKLVFKRDNHDIRAIIESVVTVMRMQAEEKGLTLATHIAVKDCGVFCDQNHLSRVIMNLLSNAVKFTPAGGVVSLSACQRFDAPEGYRSYEIKVSDTGIGMSPEFLKRVFEPFERERTSTVSGMQGTGLGMAIVKHIVDTAGDSITVESQPGEGTTFTFNVTLVAGNVEQDEMVMKDGKVKKHHSKEELKQCFQGKRILLVEDNEFNSTIAYTILENAGFLVETAENGLEAVNKVAYAPIPNYYDAILMDIQMPIMDGYEAARKIRALDGERSKVKIVAVTANAFETDKEKAKDAGMDGHVSKPLDVDILYETLLDITDLQ